MPPIVSKAASRSPMRPVPTQETIGPVRRPRKGLERSGASRAEPATEGVGPRARGC